MGLWGHGKAGPLAGPDGTTLAGLCWKFVKHPERAKNSRTVTNFPHFCARSALDRNPDRPKMSSFHPLFPENPDDKPEAPLRRRHPDRAGRSAEPSAGADPCSPLLATL